MSIRNYRPGDEVHQAAIYNDAAGHLPKFKPSTSEEIKRRTPKDDDTNYRFFAEDGGQIVGYASFNPNGRISYPWCRPGYEKFADPLFDAALDAMRQRGFRNIFACYRPDWTPILDFFRQRRFQQTREMVNFIIDLVEMPTPPSRPSSAITAMMPEDVKAIFEFAPDVLRAQNPEELAEHLLENPFFPPDSIFVLRARDGKTPIAAGIMVLNPEYADPNVLDSDMPCFRLGAFGTEGTRTKRVNGLFSFVCRKDQSISALGLDLLGQAAFRVREQDDIECFAAQVPSDAPELLKFYQRNFRRQGSFPILERQL